MSFSNTFETHVLNYVFNATSVTRPTSWFLALFTAAPTDGSSGTEVSSGTLIAYGSLSTNKTIETNDTLRVPASDITITLD